MWKGVYIATVVAIKRYKLHESSKKKSREDSERTKHMWFREIELQSTLRHPRVVCVLGATEDPESNLLLVTEYCRYVGVVWPLMQALLMWYVGGDTVSRVAVCLCLCLCVRG